MAPNDYYNDRDEEIKRQQEKANEEKKKESE